MSWIKLSERKPEGPDCVILYPIISDVGILYTCSNPDYARSENAMKQGYTHWMPFEPHPDEKTQYEYNASLYEDEDW